MDKVDRLNDLMVELEGWYNAEKIAAWRQLLQELSYRRFGPPI